MPGDLVFAFGYGLLLTGLLGLLRLRLPASWQPAGRLLMWTPLLVYALMVANAVAFVARPAQQIPACF